MCYKSHQFFNAIQAEIIQIRTMKKVFHKFTNKIYQSNLVHFFLEKEARRKHSNLGEFPSIMIAGAMLDQPYRFVQYHFHWAQHDDEGNKLATISLFF